MRTRRTWITRAVLVVMLLLALTTSVFASNPTDEPGSKMIECPDCGTSTACMVCYGLDPQCESCGGTNVCATCGGTGYVQSPSSFYNTAFSLLPPVIAIALALITKEVYSSLFIGILVGGLLYSNFAFEGTLVHVFSDGIVSVLSDSYNVGILIFLVILGAMVCLMNKAGGSAAFGRWAAQNIKSRVGAQLASIVLGVLIFIDDYFNCLTVGSVMRPITDKHNVSRVKLAYLIDATAAPVCIIAPISSWAAAVSSYVPDGQGLSIFIKAIPFNFYALFTIVMMISMVVMKVEFGPMLKYERNAVQTGDLFSGSNPYAGLIEEDSEDGRGKVIDLVLPILVLVSACVIGMLYSGSFFDPTNANHLNIASAFSSSDASVGLMLGSSFGLLFTLVFYGLRRAMSFKQMMECIPEGFKAMVSPMLILTLAWTLSGMTNLLGAKYYVANLLGGSAAALQYLLPVIIFLVAVFLAFATGTSWGTFSILIPIVCHAFPQGEMLVVSIAACLSGAVCGDHCSPISDTTIMASAGAHCSHVNHVSTQLPYAITAASCSAACYVITGLTQMFLGSSASLWTSLILLGVAIVLELVVLNILRVKLGKKTKA